MNLNIYRCYTESLMEQQTLQELLQLLPHALHERALRYKSELSAYNYVVGRLLLKRGLESLGLCNDLEKMEFQENGKPMLTGIHFNISHSDHQVICGLSKDGALGLDLEKITPIDFEDFTTMFSAHEWATIKGAKDPMASFYWFWTRKESIIKALGLSLIDLHQIELDVSSNYFVVEGKQWFLRDLDVGEAYVGALCSEQEIENIEFAEVRF